MRYAAIYLIIFASTSTITTKTAKIQAALYCQPETASDTRQRKLSTNCVIETLAGSNCIATDHRESLSCCRQVTTIDAC